MSTDITEMVKKILDLPGIKNYSYFTKYYLYKSDSMDIPTSKDLDQQVKDGEAWKNSNTSCFAQLKYGSTENFLKGANRLAYFINGRVPLDDEDVKYWVNMCVKNKMLPDYVGDENIKNKVLVLDISDKKMSPSLLYVYLSSFRFLSEDATFVKAAIILSKQYKLPFLLAWVLASKAQLHNTGHSFTRLNKACYGQSAENFIKATQIPVNILLGLKRYLKDPSKYDKRRIINSANDFDATNIIKRAGDGVDSTLIKLSDINNIYLSKIIRARTEKTEDTYIKEFHKSVKK